MDIIDVLRSLVAPQEWSELLNNYKKRKPVPMRIRNKVFGQAVFYPSVRIPWSVLKETLSNIPVVRRGTRAYQLGGDDLETQSIEPQGFSTVSHVSAAELNNLKALGLTNIKKYFEMLQSGVMRKIEFSTEALCAQSLTGKISYPMKTSDGAAELFEVDFGEPLRYSFTESLNAAGATIETVYSALQDMDEKIQSKGYGMNLEVLCGKTLFARILTLAGQNKSNVLDVKVSKGQVNVGGYIVNLENGSYQTMVGGMKTVVKTVPDDQMVMIDLDAGHTPYFAALDDLDAGLQALPFFAKVIKTDDPSGADVYTMSKPLPAVVVDAICWTDGALAA
ncbi:major capsid protein [Vibrio rumoiensis]|uniref:major capsid protein n=1 Tax=Vibrio rumoiensis TaxID=76258 RepID=UPI003AA88814